jgi:outer membrane lipoprotein LolB
MASNSRYNGAYKLISTFILLFTINFIAGCATNTWARSNSLTYQGRLSLRISSDPPQSLSAVFDISGNAQAGELTLSTPLGNTLAKLHWSAESAVLVANGTTSTYASTNELMEHATGTVIPLSALFDWLAGINTPIEGWSTDPANMQNPENLRIVANRTSPLPAVELKIALDKPW